MFGVGSDDPIAQPIWGQSISCVGARVPLTMDIPLETDTGVGGRVDREIHVLSHFVENNTNYNNNKKMIYVIRLKSECAPCKKFNFFH